MSLILAYDFGTGGIKASLYDEQGACLADGFGAYETLYPAHGFHEQRPGDWWRATVQSTREMLAAMPGDTAQQIGVIGISGHSLGVVPLDADGVLLREAVPIWSDSRPDTQPQEFFAHIPERDWYALTGNGFPPALYSIFKLMWFRDREPGMFGRIHKVLGTKDYINFRLCGEMATDQSYASGSGVYDLEKRVYSDALIAASGIPGDVLADIVPSTEVLGTLTAEASSELGLPRSVKVAAGGVDNSCMSLGAGAFREGRAYNSLGSSSWIAVSSARPLLENTKRPYVFDHVVPGQYVSALAIFSAGSSLSWVASRLCHDLEERAEAEGTSVYALLDEEAATSPVGANGLIFNPSLAGGSSLDATPELRGAFLNLDLRHTRADLLRATSEGIALGLRSVLDELRALTQVAEPLTLVGGGAKSPFWRQMFADTYGMPVVRTRAGQQAAALGAAAVAGVGSGIWDDFGIIDEISAVTGRESPVGESTRQYERVFAKYRQATRLLGEWAQADSGE
jgi:xylulokinase